jgi:hypothetical protein
MRHERALLLGSRALARRDTAVPRSTGWDRRVLMDQLPAVLAPFKAIGLACHDVLGRAALENDVGALWARVARALATGSA